MRNANVRNDLNKNSVVFFFVCFFCWLFVVVVVAAVVAFFLAGSLEKNVLYLNIIYNLYPIFFLPSGFWS